MEIFQVIRFKLVLFSITRKGIYYLDQLIHIPNKKKTVATCIVRRIITSKAVAR